MKPRYDPEWTMDGAERFVGYANELDVWVETPTDKNSLDSPLVIIVGPDHLLSDPARAGSVNFDAYEAVGGLLERVEHQDVHTTPHDMALIYQIATREGVFDDTKV